MDPASAASPLSVLEAERARLENATAKLRSSNAELTAALAQSDLPADDRAELRAALNENLPIIAKYVARIEALGKEIAKARRAAGLPDASEPERVEVGDGVGAGAPPTAIPQLRQPTQPGAPGAPDGVWL